MENEFDPEPALDEALYEVNKVSNFQEEKAASNFFSKKENIKCLQLPLIDEIPKPSPELTEDTPLSRVRRALNFEIEEKNSNLCYKTKTTIFTNPQSILESISKIALHEENGDKKTEDTAHSEAKKENQPRGEQLTFENAPLDQISQQNSTLVESFDLETANTEIEDEVNDIVEALIKETASIVESETEITGNTLYSCKPRITECRTVIPSLVLDKLFKGQLIVEDVNRNTPDLETSRPLLDHLHQFPDDAHRKRCYIYLVIYYSHMYINDLFIYLPIEPSFHI